MILTTFFLLITPIAGASPVAGLWARAHYAKWKRGTSIRPNVDFLPKLKPIIRPSLQPAAEAERLKIMRTLVQELNKSTCQLQLPSNFSKTI